MGEGEGFIGHVDGHSRPGWSRLGGKTNAHAQNNVLSAHHTAASRAAAAESVWASAADWDMGLGLGIAEVDVGVGTTTVTVGLTVTEGSTAEVEDPKLAAATVTLTEEPGTELKAGIGAEHNAQTTARELSPPPPPPPPPPPHREVTEHTGMEEKPEKQAAGADADVLTDAHSGGSGPPRGVSPALRGSYVAGGVHCDDQQVEAARVNDDFCDCPAAAAAGDPTDEPGTAACAAGGGSGQAGGAGGFYCGWIAADEAAAARGGLAVSIALSRMNDGICDCCDGPPHDSPPTRRFAGGWVVLPYSSPQLLALCCRRR
jgi:hypothetical protein